MMHPESEMTAAEMIVGLWRNCRNSARYSGHVNAEAVQRLIFQTRELLRFYGATEHDITIVLFDLYTTAHWDWPEPTARIFEALLAFEVSEYFEERMTN